MQYIANLFSAQPTNIFEDRVTPELLRSHRKLDHKFFILLKRHPQSFVEYIDSPSLDRLDGLQKVTLVHLVLIHSKEHGDRF
jgi:hypothetical protein